MIDFGGPRAASSVGPVVCFVPLFEPAPIDELPHFVSKLRKIAGQVRFILRMFFRFSKVPN
jgi:hypothetical protein